MSKYKLTQKTDANGTTQDIQLDASCVDLSGYVPTSRTINSKALSSNITLAASDVNALPSYSKSISTGAGNPREIRFVRVNYATFDGNNAAYFKIGAMCSHGNGSSYTFLEDIIIGVSATPSVTCTVYKQVQNTSTYTVDGHTVYFGDVYWVVNTTDKYVDFYIIGGQYATLMFTPFTRIGNTVSDTSKIVQYTGSATLYSSGTRVWNTLGNGGLYATSADLSTCLKNNVNGTLVGNSSDTPLYLRSQANASYIGFQNSSGTTLGYYGVNSSKKPVFYDTSDHQLAYTSDVNGKQDTLVSGTNIKTINGNSVLGSGDLTIGGGGIPYIASYDTSATATASGLGSLALKAATASGTNSLAFGGSGVNVSGTNAIGLGSSVSGNYGVAIGSGNSNKTEGCITIGRNIVGGNTGSILIGYEATCESESYGIHSVAIGNSAKATGDYNVVLGYNAQASTTASTVDKSYGRRTVVIGSNASSYYNSTGGENVLVGYSAKAYGNRIVCIGYNTSAGTTDTPLSNQTRLNCGSYTSSGRALLLGAYTAFTYMNAAGASWTSASDIRDKTDVAAIDHALDFIKKLRPITYVMNNREDYLIRDENGSPILDENGKQQYDVAEHQKGTKKKHRRFAGLSAQATYQAMLECYDNNDNYAQIVDDNKYDHPNDEYIQQYCMSYERLVPFLIKAMQEQQAKIEELENKIKNLE